MSSNVVNKAPQAFKGKEKASHNSGGGSPRRKLVIHGPIDDKQLSKKQKKLPIISKESLESEMLDSNDGSNSKPLFKYMVEALGKANDGKKDHAKKKKQIIG
jgi:hypothetical protein